MTTVTRNPRPTEEPEPVEADLSVGQFFHRLYALFYNKRFGLLLILALGVLSLLGVLFIQAPDHIRQDPQAYASWVEQLRPRYGGWTLVLDKLGVFTMFSSIAFTVVTSLLALSIVACTTHRLPQLWKQATKPHLHVKDTFFDHARSRGSVQTGESADAAYERVAAELRQEHFRVVRDPDHPHALYADRNRWAPFGTVAAHAAFVIILAGVVVTGTFGYRNDDFVAPVGSVVEVAPGTGLTLRANSFTDEYHPDGRPKDYYSDLELFSNGQRVAASEHVRVNSPLTWGGYKFNQATFGVVADLTVVSKSGTITPSVPLENQAGDQETVYGSFKLPELDLEVYVIGAASGAQNSRIKPGQMRIELYRIGGQEPVASKLLNQSEATAVGDLTITFNRERTYTGLMVVRDPGAPLVWIGSALLFLGMCLTMFWRHHRLWVRVTPADDGARVRLASPDRHDSMFERRFQAFVERLNRNSACTKEQTHA